MFNSGSMNANKNLMGFRALSELAMAQEHQRADAGEIAVSSAKIFCGRVKNYLLPHFRDLKPSELSPTKVNGFVEALQQKGLKRSSIRLILTSLRRVLHYAYLHDQIPTIPTMPRIYSDSTPRGGFTSKEYLSLWQGARRLCRIREAAGIDAPSTQIGFFSKGHPMLDDMPYLIRFMVNSFIRPTDLRWIQHRHIQVCRGRHVYLRLELPESKRHTSQIISMRPAVAIYEALRERARLRGQNRPDDYVFLPEVGNRKTAMVLLDLYFRRVLEACDLRFGKRGQVRTLYSLRHTAITFRLLYGRGIDLLTLARNARTSVEMIERFYASELSAEMNIDLLHSRRAIRN